ncbi:class I SAM-dependent methyltransferase [Mobilitalea sibirica]|uniref:Class I SAM-dependent methyltransferase n=1 Tax=Mobilitalea sibirica TaxID=1462919 RepID=A0A8J7H5Y6_9FIRM|nr:class I SAM-dependent methyltransferase [Mobilitalea sibirica]MBH1940426.1 class I SAM-dependent methyltransferase [Mobilitalea sibirica]
MSFNESALNWDTEKRIKRAKIIAKEIIRAIEPRDNLTAMEFGCGTGLISFNMYERFEMIYLVDSSQGMIDQLNSKIIESNIKNMKAYCTDITKESLNGMKLDVIYHSMVLHHIKDTNFIIKSFYDLLNDSGCLCIVDLDEEDGSFHRKESGFDGHNGFHQDSLKKILEHNGFQEIKSRTFFYDHKEIDGQTISYSLFIMTGRKHN